uniref:Uncharacterized protein n=1 Tax=Lutzomyia longipalpis TaxID=7200 RepID=A0A1B0CIH8_LUTLO
MWSRGVPMGLISTIYSTRVGSGFYGSATSHHFFTHHPPRARSRVDNKSHFSLAASKVPWSRFESPTASSQQTWNISYSLCVCGESCSVNHSVEISSSSFFRAFSSCAHPSNKLYILHVGRILLFCCKLCVSDEM